MDSVRVRTILIGIVVTFNMVCEPLAYESFALARKPSILPK